MRSPRGDRPALDELMRDNGESAAGGMTQVLEGDHFFSDKMAPRRWLFLSTLVFLRERSYHSCGDEVLGTCDLLGKSAAVCELERFSQKSVCWNGDSGPVPGVGFLHFHLKGIVGDLFALISRQLSSHRS